MAVVDERRNVPGILQDMTKYLDARREEQNQEIEGEMIFVSQ
jgi:hypothetical protein